MVEFFAIPQLPDCTPQSAKYSSFCQYNTVDLEDKQLYFPVYIINFSEYYYIQSTYYFFGMYIVFVQGLNFRLDI